MQRIACLVVVVLLWGASTPAVAQGSREPSFTGMLTRLCAIPGNAGEPACSKIKELTEDEAWLILRTACDPLPSGVTACQEFWQAHGGLLVYDWRGDRWDAWWEKRQFPLKFDVAGVPTARLKRGDARPLKIMIANVSPLTYTAVPGLPKEDDLAVVAGLKSFLAAAGTALQGALAILAVTPVTPSPSVLPDPAPVGGGDVVGFSAASGKKTAAQACKPLPPDTTTLADEVRNRQRRILTMSAAIDALDKEVDRLADAKANYVKVAQKIEDGLDVTRADLVEPDVPGLTTAYVGLHEEMKSLGEHTSLLGECQPMLAAYSHLLAGPPNLEVMKQLAERIENADQWTCKAPAVKPVSDAVMENARRLVAGVDKCDQPALKTHLETHRDAMKPLVDRLMNAKQAEEKVWAAIGKAVEAKKEMMAGADVLGRRVRSAQRHTWKGVLIKSLVVTRQNPELPWNKIQAHEIIAKADSPYVKELTLKRGAEEKRSYRLESATGQILGYGVGLIYTPLHESTYSAVAVPGETKKVIRETGRETRAGDLAAFLTYRFVEHWPLAHRRTDDRWKPEERRFQPVLDVGVGLTSDRPAFFIGPAFEIARAARVGIGWAPQRVSTLDGQIPDVTEVTDASEIRTRKTFDLKNWYLSFSFALDSLSLFNSK